MKKITALLLVILSLLPYAFAWAENEEIDEDEIDGIATPGMEISLEEYAEQNSGELPEGLDLEPADPFIIDNNFDDEDEKGIIGTDDRIKVKKPKKYPYTAIAYMKAHARCGCTWTGTAFMVGKRGAMTAAHCLVCTDHGKPIDRATFYFGYKSKNDYYYKYNGEFHFWYGTDFNKGKGDYGDYMEWDYGYIRFKSKVGERTGWFGTSVKSDSELKNGKFEVAGYRNGDLRKDYSSMNPYGSFLLEHLADTKGGYSGCPVFDKNYYVVAINIAETTSSFSGKTTRNVARRLTNSLMTSMKDNKVIGK